MIRSLAKILLALICCLPLLAAQASEVKYLDVTLEGELYEVAMDVQINAPSSEVLALMSDHRNLARLSPNTRKSVVLSEQPASGKAARIKVVLHPCLLLFCKDLVKISDIDYPARNQIRYTAVGGRGNFKQALELLEFVDLGRRTLMRYRATLEPDFRVPSLLGTRLVEYIIRNDLHSTARNLEQIIAPGAEKRATSRKLVSVPNR